MLWSIGSSRFSARITSFDGLLGSVQNPLLSFEGIERLGGLRISVIPRIGQF